MRTALKAWEPLVEVRHRLIGKVTYGLTVEEIVRRRHLHHQDEDELLFRIDIERRAEGAIPEERADRSGERISARVRADREAQAKALPHGRGRAVRGGRRD